MTIRDNWPYDRVVPTEDEAIYDLLGVLETEYDRVDVELDELQEQRFIETATTNELEKLASEVGVVRQTGESDKRFRFRTIIAKAVTRSSGNIYELAQLLKILFGEDVENITLSVETDKPVVLLTLTDFMIQDVPVTQSVLEDLLSQVLPSSDNLNIVLSDSFAFEGDSPAGGFNEGEWA